MTDIQAALGIKILSLAVIFNSVLSVIFAGDILYIFYAKPASHPYQPYLLDGFLFCFVIIASILNIITAKILGDVDLKRIKFHHYFYGFMMSGISFVFIALFAPSYLFTLLMPTSISDNYSSAALLMVYGGMTLVINDIQDVSLKLRTFFNNLKRKIQSFGMMVEMLHLCSCVVSIYVTLSVIIWGFVNRVYSKGFIIPEFSAGFFTLNLLITSIWGLGVVKKRFWLLNTQGKDCSSHIRSI